MHIPSSNFNYCPSSFTIYIKKTYNLLVYCDRYKDFLEVVRLKVLKSKAPVINALQLTKEASR